MRIITIFLTLLLATALHAGVTKQDLAAAQGIDHFDEVEEVMFVFQAKSSRRWTWRPKSGYVKLEYTEKDGTPKTIEYNRNEIGEGASDEILSADKKWINDTFWLMWPLHLLWSEDATLSEPEPAQCPITGAEATRVILSYPPEGGGYTPGDAYHIYLDKENLPISWEFHRGGQEKSNLTCTWEDYKQVGPLKLSTMHRNADNTFELSIPELEVKVLGGK